VKIVIFPLAVALIALILSLPAHKRWKTNKDLSDYGYGRLDRKEY